MQTRCFNPRSTAWKDYGGRGITVCARWRKFENFFADMGPRPTVKHSIDRIDNDGDYEPSNVRWVLPEKQANNTRQNVHVVLGGEELTIAQWARRTGIKAGTIARRVRSGYSPKRALTAELWARE